MVLDLLKTLIDAGLSQAEISRRTGIPQPSIHRLLTGKQTDVVYTHGKSLERVVNDLHADHPLRQPEKAAA